MKEVENTGHGLKKRVIKGKGLASKQLLNDGKFHIDIEKLNNNRLCYSFCL